MYIVGKRADKLIESDIERLISNQIQENKSLDYKKELNISKDADRKEFLYDISAMYNTDGGCIIFGIEEEKDSKNQNTGKPLKVTGIPIENFDKLTQQIEDIVKSNTEPRINHLIIKELEVGCNKILIIGIPKGLGLPSMVTFNESNKFYKRRNSGKFAVDVYELNQMFLQNQVLAEKANRFRKERIYTVLSQESIPNLNTDNAFFIHIIPFGFLDYQILDFTTIENELTIKMKPLYARGWDNMYNIDGFATFSTSDDRKSLTAYNQIFRNGIYEVYSTNLFYKTRFEKLGFDGDKIIVDITNYIKTGLFVLNELKVEPPFLISFSFHNIRGTILDINRYYQTREFKQNEILFPFVLVHTYESNLQSILKPLFDILWQSYGFSKSPD